MHQVGKLFHGQCIILSRNLQVVEITRVNHHQVPLHVERPGKDMCFAQGDIQHMPLRPFFKHIAQVDDHLDQAPAFINPHNAALNQEADIGTGFANEAIGRKQNVALSALYLFQKPGQKVLLVLDQFDDVNCLPPGNLPQIQLQFFQQQLVHPFYLPVSAEDKNAQRPHIKQLPAYGISHQRLFERPPLPVEALHRHTQGKHDNKQQNNNRNQTIVPNGQRRKKDRKNKGVE